MSPALGEEVNKDLGYAGVRVSQGSQGLAGQDSDSQSGGADVMKLQNVGRVWPGKITKASLNTACISLHQLEVFFLQKQ